jgi:peptidoglycan/xylan/chitin deacetylase (PgdA/CDA1 family)
VGPMAFGRLKRRLVASPPARELGRRLPGPLRRVAGRLVAGTPPAARSTGARRGARLILMYHRVATTASDPLELCVAPERFREHLELLRSLGRIVPLADIARARSNGLLVAITFDDGYADNALAAAPLLEEQDAHATVFVVAGAVGSTKAFWWDRLSALAGLEGYWQTWERLRVLPAERIEAELEARGPAPVTEGRPLSEAELVALASGPVEIGAHTVSHPSLPALEAERQRSEIAGSRERLEELIGRPPQSFAYPYGDYDPVTVRLVKRTGFQLACTIHENRLSRFSSPFLLPRYPVRDWPAEELERRLAAWT